MGRVVSPTPTPLSSGRVVPALVASYDMHGRAVGLFYTQPTVSMKCFKNPMKESCQAGRRCLETSASTVFTRYTRNSEYRTENSNEKPVDNTPGRRVDGRPMPSSIPMKMKTKANQKKKKKKKKKERERERDRAARDPKGHITPQTQSQRHHRIHSKNQKNMEMGWTSSENERQQMDQAVHRMASLERGKIKTTALQKVAG